MELLDTVYSALHETVSASMFTFTMKDDLWERVDADPNAARALERIVVKVLSEYFGGESVPVEGQKSVRRYVLGGDVAAQFSHSFHPAKECPGKDCLHCRGEGVQRKRLERGGLSRPRCSLLDDV
ncbi:MAG: hypothetical protein JRN42_02105 [Nitrososphaerota archaeon]|nr:hypothetical protein [Ferrimicrobium acidiphilum]MDG6937320.1 hypothetical protein [Nitrososphaerota archaeon]